MREFACTGCGSCCRRVLGIDPVWPVRADGACLHLATDNSCTIYSTRPLVCRVEDMRPSTIPKRVWYRANAASCNQMQEEDGVAPELRVMVSGVREVKKQ